MREVRRTESSAPKAVATTPAKAPVKVWTKPTFDEKSACAEIGAYAFQG